MTAETLTRQEPPHRVRVWFGSRVIADQTFEVELAERYEHGMRRRFPGLRVTNDVTDPTGTTRAT